jgi:hypothetical protein
MPLETIFKGDHKPTHCIAPILNGHRPFSGCCLNGQIDHFAHGVIGWKYLALLDGMANDAIQRFNRIGGVNRFAYVPRVRKEGVEIVPVAAPGFADLRVLLIPLLGKSIQGLQPQFFGPGPGKSSLNQQSLSCSPSRRRI